MYGTAHLYLCPVPLSLPLVSSLSVRKLKWPRRLRLLLRCLWLVICRSCARPTTVLLRHQSLSVTLSRALALALVLIAFYLGRESNHVWSGEEELRLCLWFDQIWRPFVIFEVRNGVLDCNSLGGGPCSFRELHD